MTKLQDASNIKRSVKVNTCLICNAYKRSKLTHHLETAHNISLEDYYDLFISKTAKPICLSNACSSSVKFIDITKGYAKYCSRKCRSKLNFSDNDSKWRNERNRFISVALKKDIKCSYFYIARINENSLKIGISLHRISLANRFFSIRASEVKVFISTPENIANAEYLIKSRVQHQNEVINQKSLNTVLNDIRQSTELQEFSIKENSIIYHNNEFLTYTIRKHRKQNDKLHRIFKFQQ